MNQLKVLLLEVFGLTTKQPKTKSFEEAKKIAFSKCDNVLRMLAKEETIK